VTRCASARLWSRRLATALLAAVAVLLLGNAAAWATHSPAPLPSLAPGQTAAPNGWTCHGTKSDLDGTTTQDCQVAGWTVLNGPPTPAALPNPLPVQEVAPLVLTDPLPVQEVSPVPAADSTVNLECGASTSSSPEPSPSPSAEPTEPEPSPSASESPQDSRCLVTASLETSQWTALLWFLGLPLLLALVTFVVRHTRPWKLG
jgi:hypothetical protein